MERRKRKRRGSHGYQPGSDGYQPGIHGYQSKDNPSAVDKDEEEFDLAARFMEPREGWWTRHGYKSLGEYLRDSREGPVRTGWLGPPQRKRRNIPEPETPTGDPPAIAPSRAGRNRQVSIRLDAEGFEALSEAARLYGIAPSTMARLLVQKGAQKVVDEG